MKKIISILIFTLFSCPVFSQTIDSSVELVYSGMKFRVPGDHVVIGSMGGNDNFLVFRYTNEPGEKYIAFTIMTNNAKIDYKCEMNVFFNDVFNENKNSKCNRDELKAFKKIFLVNKNVGKWNNENYDFFYTIGKDDSFLFVVNKNGKVVKIDSDFMNKEGLKHIVHEYLN